MPSKYQIALVARGKWSVRNPPPFSLSNIAVKPHSSPGRGPKLHISTARRSPGSAGFPSVSTTQLLSWIEPAVQSTISIRNISPVLISVTGELREAEMELGRDQIALARFSSLDSPEKVEKPFFKLSYSLFSA
uniref:Uncharacterized protein n=1 Tax=Solanum lycopersicum TaxID=4081 RepID=A0A3Q7FZ93_SOLLC